MARPAKALSTKTGHTTKAENTARKQLEEISKGGTDKLKPPAYLTKKQKDVFKYILEQLDESKMLGNLDVFILAKASVTISQLQELDETSNKDPNVLYSAGFMRARAEATKDFFRCCNELCLSPQARAKLSISAVKTQEKKTLMDLINEDDDD